MFIVGDKYTVHGYTFKNLLTDIKKRENNAKNVREKKRKRMRSEKREERGRGREER